MQAPMMAKVNRDYRLEFCPAAALKPLSADVKALKKTIASFKADGHTGGHMGIQWSWYMLSPKWQNVLPKASQPQEHDTKKVAKYAILMTDGEFNTAFAGVAKNGDTTNQAALSRSHAERLCSEMRKDGIEIFTVGFMLKEAGAKGVLKNARRRTPARSSTITTPVRAPSSIGRSRTSPATSSGWRSPNRLGLRGQLAKEKAAASDEAGGLPCFRPWRGLWP